MTWTTRPRSDLGHGLTGHRSGSGPLLVLIHGVGLRLEAWNALAPLLARRFTVLAVDMPGHGKSKPPKTATLSAFTEPFAALLADIGPAHVAGHSMGAMIALDLGAQHPGLVSGIAAMNAVYRRSPDAAQAVQARAQAIAQGAKPDPEPTIQRWFDQPTSAEAMACRTWLTQADPAGYSAAYHTFAHHDGPADSDLSGLTCPALFLTGDRDLNSTPAMSQAMADLVRGGRAVTLAGAAHMAPMTSPTKIAGDLLSVFGGLT